MCTYTGMHIYIHTHTRAHTYIYIYIYIGVCVSACAWLRACTVNAAATEVVNRCREDSFISGTSDYENLFEFLE